MESTDNNIATTVDDERDKTERARRYISSRQQESRRRSRERGRSHIPEQCDAAASFLGDALQATSLMLFSVKDPATGHGHYCHMNDLRPVIQAMRRFPNNRKIALWACTILRDVSTTNANMVKISKLGGAEAITTVMIMQLDSFKVQLKGLRALYALLFEEKESVDLAVRCGLEDHLVNVLKLYRHIPEIRSLGTEELKIIDYKYLEILNNNADEVTNQLNQVRIELDEGEKKASLMLNESLTPYKKK
eukprot:g581.t1